MSDLAEAVPSVLPWDTSAGNRFAPYSSENHSASLWIVALLGLIYVIGVLLIRISIKRRVFGLDDSLIIVSTVIGIGQSVIIYKALADGLGKIPQNVPNVRLVGKLVFSSRSTTLVALYFAKISGIFLLRRLFAREQKTIRLLCDFTLALIVVCGVASVLLSTIGCPSYGFFTEHCSSQVTRWFVITALDVGTEIWTLFLPPYLVWQLQMCISYKLRVIIAFCSRIFVIVLSIIHLKAWINYTHGTPSPFLVIPTLIWQQSLLAWSLISATIPNLKAFLTSLSANWGGGDWGYSSRAYGNGTFEMKNMGPSQQTNSKIDSGTRSLAHGEPQFSTEIHTTRRKVGEKARRGSGGSQDLIIRKETAWAVERA